MADVQIQVELVATLAPTTRMALAVVTRTVVVAATAHTSQLARSQRAQLLRLRLTAVASTSVQQPRALATARALGMVATAGIQAMGLAKSATLRSLQKLENPDHWSGFSFA
jgi:hypothetical protein